MRDSDVVNLFSVCVIAFCLGGIFWLWQGQFLLFVEPEESSEIIPVTNREILEREKIVENLELGVSSSQVFSGVTKVSSSSVSSLSSSKNLKKVLPETFNLAVPFTSQAPEKKWSQPWQDACEEAAILMIDAYYKSYLLSPLFVKDEIIKMVQWEENKTWGLSIEAEKIQKIFQDYMQGYNSKTQKVSTSPSTVKNFYHVKIIENPTIDEIKQYIANGQPVLVVADGKILPNPYFQNGGPEYHVLVIRGYTKDSFITNDPGTQFGENFKYKYDDLMNAIRDWNSGEVKSGRRVVLVVE